MYFHYFVIISPWKRAWPFIWTNLNSLHPRMFCAKFGWNWPSGSGEEDGNVKSLRQQRRRQRRTTDKFWSEKLTWAFGSGELKTKRWLPLNQPFRRLMQVAKPHLVWINMMCRGTSGTAWRFRPILNQSYIVSLLLQLGRVSLNLIPCKKIRTQTMILCMYKGPAFAKYCPCFPPHRILGECKKTLPKSFPMHVGIHDCLTIHHCTVYNPIMIIHQFVSGLNGCIWFADSRVESGCHPACAQVCTCLIN